MNEYEFGMTLFVPMSIAPEILLEEAQKIAAPGDFLAKMRYGPHERGDVLFLTGVGDGLVGLIQAIFGFFFD